MLTTAKKFITHDVIIREHDPILYAFVLQELSSRNIPDFTRDFDSLTRWNALNDKSISEDIWTGLYHELTSVEDYENVTNALNNTRSIWKTIPLATLQEFIILFPTLLWISLLQKTKNRISSFILILHADRLDFVVQNIQRLEDQNKTLDLMTLVRL